MSYATGKQSHAISDRSGQAFPYKEMVREWTGALVHISEFEPKHPQIRRRTVKADAIALKNSRAQDFTFDSGGAIFTTIDLTLPGQFAFQSSGMQPDNGAEQNRRRQINMNLNSVTVEIT
tara:strand:+ start:192 stop:551 length:360 start_codon:yes stop_codon:yes gene_type:complete